MRARQDGGGRCDGLGDRDVEGAARNVFVPILHHDDVAAGLAEVVAHGEPVVADVADSDLLAGPNRSEHAHEEALVACEERREGRERVGGKSIGGSSHRLGCNPR